jgi:hypothetical protein
VVQVYAPETDLSDPDKKPLKPQEKMAAVKVNGVKPDDDAEWIVVAPKPAPAHPAPQGQKNFFSKPENYIFPRFCKCFMCVCVCVFCLLFVSC